MPFVALPRAKSDAMCAMYAFMRRADDIADDESLPTAARREVMAGWLRAFQQSSTSQKTTSVPQKAVNGETPCNAEQPLSDGLLSEDDRLVFVAVRETQRRFGIADELLEELVAGTAMDLPETLPEGVVRVVWTQTLPAPDASPGRWQPASQPVGTETSAISAQSVRHFDCYESVEALDRYCYLVASVVGLVTVRIFGVHGTAADADAIRMGKAFQYTNILRDVREDAERGRVYLPLDVLRAHRAGVEDVVAASTEGVVSAGLQAAMEAMGTRAEDFYDARHTLLPLLARDSRPAMRVLIRIYHTLLLKIQTQAVCRLQAAGERVDGTQVGHPGARPCWQLCGQVQVTPHFDVVVVGAGLAGLAAASALARAGANVAPRGSASLCGGSGLLLPTSRNGRGRR